MLDRSAGTMPQSGPDAGAAEGEDGGTLRLLFEVNERALQAMSQSLETLARASPAGLMAQTHDVWRNADHTTLCRAARCPTLLLDIRGWNSAQHSPADSGFFPPDIAIDLMRSTLTLAWHVCRTRPNRTGIMLGLPQSSTCALASLGLADLERLAQTRAPCLRPRWLHSPGRWTALLMAARSGCPRSLEDFHLRALQELLGELLFPHTAS